MPTWTVRLFGHELLALTLDWDTDEPDHIVRSVATATELRTTDWTEADPIGFTH